MPGGGNTYKRIICSCLHCKNKLSANNLNIHFKSKQCLSGFIASKSHATIFLPSDLTCEFCNKKCKNDNSYRQHLVRCSKNPNCIEVKKSIGNRTKGRTPWNKGLTKDTDHRVDKYADTIKKAMKKLYDTGYRSPTQTEIYWTDKKRKEKSEWRKKLHKDNPETHPNRRLAGNRNKMTYPEKVAYDYLIANKINFEHQKPILNYFVDFCIGHILIEIDGEKWHAIGNEKDIQRDLKLSELGYKVYRIRSKERIEDRLREIFLGVLSAK